MLNRRKIILFIIMVLFTALSSEANVLAAKQRVHDKAELFSKTDIEALEERSAEMSERLHMDIAIVTITDNEGKTSREYADDFYDQNGYGYDESKDGLLFLINMDNREIYISTCGKAIEYFTDARIESMLANIKTYIKDKDYINSATKFLDNVEYYVQEGIPANQYTVSEEDTPANEYTESEEDYSSKPLIICLVISLVIGAIPVIIMIKHNQGLSSIDENTYLKSDSFKLIKHRDKLYDTKITYEDISTSSSSSSSSSSDCSTTHSSSSGTTHGGGGSSF